MRKHLAIVLIGVANRFWPKEKSARIVCKACGLKREWHVKSKHVFTPFIQYACSCRETPDLPWLPTAIKTVDNYGTPTLVTWDEMLEKVE